MGVSINPVTGELDLTGDDKQIAAQVPFDDTYTSSQTAGFVVGGNVQEIIDKITDGFVYLASGLQNFDAEKTARNINKTAHGLSVGDWVREMGGSDSSSGSYVLAQADSLENSQVLGVVIRVDDADNFTIALQGYVTALSGLTPSTVYYLDPDTPGTITATRPSTPGQIIKPVLFAVGTTRGVVNLSYELPNTPIIGTKEQILSLSPEYPQIAYATDTTEFFFWVGDSWFVCSIGLSEESPNPDMGYTQKSDKAGYSKEFITDKTLYNIVLLGNAKSTNGAIRVNTSITPNRFQVYLRNKWNTIYEDLTTENNDFRHTPLNKQIYIWRGDSISLGLNGRPLIQEYNTCMGAYPPKRIMSGGTF